MREGAWHDQDWKMEALMEGTKQKMSTKPAGVRSRRPRAASAHSFGRGGGAVRQLWSRKAIPVPMSRAMRTTGERALTRSRTP